MNCPICSFSVADARGLAAHFRHQAATHPGYATWQEDRRFEGKSENEDFVRCLVCGQRAETLARHLKAAHRITADEYRIKYPDALIRSRKTTAKRQDALREGRKSVAYKGDKTLTCPVCSLPWDTSKFTTPNAICPVCQQKAEVAKWAGLSEPDDFVSCLECSYRAENLASHIQNAHPSYRVRHPGALLVALRSAVRDKTALQGKVLSDETKQKMSENAGRWNAGLTKTTDPRLATASEKMLGRPTWNKGLTVEADPRVAEAARKLQFYTGEGRPWDNGLAVNLSLSDFAPFMDAEGRVDHHKVIEATGVSWVTVRKYIVDLGLRETRRYIEGAADDRTIRLEREVLERFRLGNGKVSIGKAIVRLGYGYPVIKRECERHGLPMFHRHISQDLCMETVGQAIGGIPYESEWKSWRFTNPLTGHRFRFDGYFPGVGLVVEFHGHQHYIFPSFCLKEGYEREYEALRERDRVKRELITAAPDLTYFEVLEDEPYTSVDYLRGRLVEMGILPRISGSPSIIP